MNYWLIKTDPDTYSWDQMKKDNSTFWDGVKNYQARNFMKDMKLGDIALFYHSQKEKEIFGEVKIIKEHYQDPTTEDERWVAVNVEYHSDFNKKVSLAQMKEQADLSKMWLIRNSRLSVMPVTETEYHIIKDLAS